MFAAQDGILFTIRRTRYLDFNSVSLLLDLNSKCEFLKKSVKLT